MAFFCLMNIHVLRLWNFPIAAGLTHSCGYDWTCLLVSNSDLTGDLFFWRLLLSDADVFSDADMVLYTFIVVIMGLVLLGLTACFFGP